jgi:hypothetical protein
MQICFEHILPGIEGHRDIAGRRCMKVACAIVDIALTCVTPKGAANSVGCTTVGAFDLVTFLVPTDTVAHSACVWSDAQRETTYVLE